MCVCVCVCTAAHTVHWLLTFTEVLRRHLSGGILSIGARFGFLKGGCFFLACCPCLSVCAPAALPGRGLSPQQAEELRAPAPDARRSLSSRASPLSKRFAGRAAARLCADSRRRLHFQPPFAFPSFPPSRIPKLNAPFPYAIPESQTARLCF